MENIQMLLKQGAVGKPCEAIVKKGDKVKRGQLIATPTGLGANVHSSVSGEVIDVTEDRIIIKPAAKQPKTFEKIKKGSNLEMIKEAETGVSDDDPYEDLASSIYGVNESDAKIQVWWRANFQTGSMTVPVTYPALVQNYNVNWPMTMMDGLLPQIVLSSKRGSADPAMTACGGRSLMLVDEKSSASVDLGGRYLGSGATNAWIGFQCYVSPDGISTAGRIARLTFGGRGATSSVTVDAMLAGDIENGYTIETATTQDGANVTSQTFKVVLGMWNEVAVDLPQGVIGSTVTATYGAANSSTADSATFVALDNLALWAGDEGDALYNFTFPADSLTTLGTNGTVRTATDAIGRRTE